MMKFGISKHKDSNGSITIHKYKGELVILGNNSVTVVSTFVYHNGNK